MRNPWTVLVVAAGTACGAGFPQGEPVNVVLEDNFTLAKILVTYKDLVAGLFEKTGVKILWGQPSAGRRSDFHIRVVGKAPSTASPSALASARIDTKSIIIFRDRIQSRLGRTHPAVAKVALAYVIAHELAHAMQGIRRHSESGILKAHWTNDDFTAMLFGRLEFAPYDAAMIRRGCSRRREASDLMEAE